MTDTTSNECRIERDRKLGTFGDFVEMHAGFTANFGCICISDDECGDFVAIVPTQMTRDRFGKFGQHMEYAQTNLLRRHA